jgi:hypothetical protein
MMLSKADNLAWLCRHSKEYQDHKVHTGEVIEDFEDFGKLGQGFASVDDLEEIDIGDGKVKRSTYISARLSGSHKQQLARVVERIPGLLCMELYRDAQVRPGLGGTHIADEKGFQVLVKIKKKSSGYWRQGSFKRVGMPSGYLVSYP